MSIASFYAMFGALILCAGVYADHHAAIILGGMWHLAGVVLFELRK
jgi:hypothetical protein